MFFFPQPVGFVSFDSRSEAEAAKNALNVSTKDAIIGGFLTNWWEVLEPQMEGI